MSSKEDMDKEIIKVLINQFKEIDHDRKYRRKLTAKLLRTYSSKISNVGIRSKIERGYFKDLTDSKLVIALQDVCTRI